MAYVFEFSQTRTRDEVIEDFLGRLQSDDHDLIDRIRCFIKSVPHIGEHVSPESPPTLLELDSLDGESDNATEFYGFTDEEDGGGVVTDDDENMPTILDVIDPMLLSSNAQVLLGDSVDHMPFDTPPKELSDDEIDQAFKQVNNCNAWPPVNPIIDEIWDKFVDKETAQSGKDKALLVKPAGYGPLLFALNYAPEHQTAFREFSWAADPSEPCIRAMGTKMNLPKQDTEALLATGLWIELYFRRFQVPPAKGRTSTPYKIVGDAILETHYQLRKDLWEKMNNPIALLLGKASFDWYKKTMTPTAVIPYSDTKIFGSKASLRIEEDEEGNITRIIISVLHPENAFRPLPMQSAALNDLSWNFALSCVGMEEHNRNYFQYCASRNGHNDSGDMKVDWGALGIDLIAFVKATRLYEKDTKEIVELSNFPPAILAGMKEKGITLENVPKGRSYSIQLGRALQRHGVGTSEELGWPHLQEVHENQRLLGYPALAKARAANVLLGYPGSKKGHETMAKQGYPHLARAREAQRLLGYPGLVKGRESHRLLGYPGLVKANATNALLGYPGLAKAHAANVLLGHPGAKKGHETMAKQGYPHLARAREAQRLQGYPGLAKAHAANALLGYPGVKKGHEWQAARGHPNLQKSWAREAALGYPNLKQGHITQSQQGYPNLKQGRITQSQQGYPGLKKGHITQSQQGYPGLKKALETQAKQGYPNLRKAAAIAVANHSKKAKKADQDFLDRGGDPSIVAHKVARRETHKVSRVRQSERAKAVGLTLKKIDEVERMLANKNALDLRSYRKRHPTATLIRGQYDKYII